MATRGVSPFFAEALSGAIRAEPHGVIVVVDGGELESAAIEHGVQVLSIAKQGRSAARNAGAEAAQTRYVAFLDDDDVLLPGGLRRLQAALDGAAAAPLAFGRVTVIDGAGRPLENWNELLDRRFGRLTRTGVDVAELLAKRAPIYTSATLVRRDAFLAVSGYDPLLDAHEDLDLYVRLAELAPLIPTCGDPVTAYRLHGQNTPSDRLYEGMLAVAEKHSSRLRGRARRLLAERHVEALWGLGRIREVRREALRALRSDPRMLAQPRFVGRFVASFSRREPTGRRG